MADPEVQNSPASTPQPGRSVSLRLTFDSHEGLVALAYANRQLSQGRPASALRLYTKILQDTSRGHPGVFLNRSLCYLLLDYPSLAVTDAYRALCAGTWIRRESEISSQAIQIITLAHFTQDAQELKEPWTIEPTCFVAGGRYKWLSTDLATLAIKRRTKEKPTKSKGAREDEGQHTNKKKNINRVANDVQMKAYYRIAFALWKCGGGALKNALDILCRAREEIFCTEEDCRQLTALENRILRYIEDRFKEEERLKQHALEKGILPRNPQSLTYSEPSGIRGLMGTRYTKIKQVHYPWDDYSLTVRNRLSRMPAIKRSIAKLAPDCQVRCMLEERKPPTLELYSVVDTPPQKMVFSESSAFYVTSSLQEGNQLFCDSCGAGLIVSPELYHQARRAARVAGGSEQASQQGTARSSADSAESLDVDEYLASPFRKSKRRPLSPEMSSPKDDNATFSFEAKQDNLALPLTPPQHHRSSVTSDSRSEADALNSFQLCPSCQDVAFCSLKCHELAVASHHLSSCCMGLEDFLRKAVLDDKHPGVPDPPMQRLHGLMLLRVLAAVNDSNKHPLELDWIRFLNVDWDVTETLADEVWNDRYPLNFDPDRPVDLDELFPVHGYSSDRSSGGRCSSLRSPGSLTGDHRSRMAPWSFEANVVRPIHCLFTMYGQPQALNVEKYDGWVINTLIAKIQTNIRVTRRPRTQKVFDESGTMVLVRSLPKVKPETLPKESQQLSRKDSSWPEANGKPQAKRSITSVNAVDLTLLDSASTKQDNNSDITDASSDNEEEEKVWVGSLHPLASLIRPTGPGEIANVTVYEDDPCLVCVATPPATVPLENVGQESADATMHDAEPPPCIRVGQTLLRRQVVVPCAGQATSSSQSPPNSPGQATPRYTKVPFTTNALSGLSTRNAVSGGNIVDTMLDADETDCDLDEQDMDESAKSSCDMEIDMDD